MRHLPGPMSNFFFYDKRWPFIPLSTLSYLTWGLGQKRGSSAKPMTKSQEGQILGTLDVAPSGVAAQAPNPSPVVHCRSYRFRGGACLGCVIRGQKMAEPQVWLMTPLLVLLLLSPVCAFLGKFRNWTSRNVGSDLGPVPPRMERGGDQKDKDAPLPATRNLIRSA